MNILQEIPTKLSWNNSHASLFTSFIKVTNVCSILRQGFIRSFAAEAPVRFEKSKQLIIGITLIFIMKCLFQLLIRSHFWEELALNHRNVEQTNIRWWHSRWRLMIITSKSHSWFFVWSIRKFSLSDTNLVTGVNVLTGIVSFVSSQLYGTQSCNTCAKDNVLWWLGVSVMARLQMSRVRRRSRLASSRTT